MCQGGGRGGAIQGKEGIKFAIWQPCYKEWQDATYYFLNAAPQWQSFNGGNWVAVEAAVRDYARKAGSRLQGGISIAYKA